MTYTTYIPERPVVLAIFRHVDSTHPVFQAYTFRLKLLCILYVVEILWYEKDGKLRWLE